jgi:hypothetical protein
MLLFANDDVILENWKDELRRSVYNLQNTPHDFNMEIYTVKTKIMILHGKDPVWSIISLCKKVSEQEKII